jgi:UDP-N-acetylglucosamine--N-acetylmuramyl-(pentapeptide) pyrophosphoryl-undecaprenol N-acetylglucosamine transferase
VADSGARGSTVAVFSGGGTGGHLYPALALAEALSALRPDVRPFFVGALRGLEATVLPKRGVEHVLLPVHGFRRGALWENVPVFADLVRSLVVTGKVFSRLRPGIVVVTGGYAGAPAGLMAAVMGIPLALQEQNALPGVTTRILSRWARQVHLAFPEAVGRLPRGAVRRARVSGNPVRAPSPVDSRRARTRFGLSPEARVILVVGGSQGAVALNRVVLEMVREVVEGRVGMPEDLQLLWATGPLNFANVEAGLEALGRPGWVHALPYIQEMPRALQASTLAVSRAGAMATSEFLAWGVPAVLVPLPTSAADHQTRNAESLAEAGAAVHLPEAGLSAPLLRDTITAILDAPEKLRAMRGAALERGRPLATEEIALSLASLLPAPPMSPRGVAA